ncbi:hypothetical protein KKE34_03880 [Patescibacteria group bacterium]|nr:hypothetical protein [Patescibacteria group bacterium]MBU1885719.1 hypothetical protein [Patescibacteria group bacterium]
MNIKKATKFTGQIIHIDNVINWVLGISLILVPDFFNRLLFGHEVISHWIYIVIGAGLVWFASWQRENFLKKDQLETPLEVPALRFSAILSWLSVLVLTLILLSGLGARILLFSKILLWIVDVSMLVLGGWYWWVAKRIRS